MDLHIYRQKVLLNICRQGGSNKKKFSLFHGTVELNVTKKNYEENKSNCQESMLKRMKRKLIKIQMKIMKNFRN
jgi:hypothetical protein